MKYVKLFGIIAGAALFGAVSTASNAAEYKITGGKSITASLSGKAGNAVNGRKLAIHKKKGNCLACHAMPIPEQQFHGEVGPALDDVGSRLSASEIRLQIVDPKIANPDTIMPAFYKKKHNFPAKKFKGKRMLKAQEIEDIVAYLVTLKGSYSK